MVGAKPETELTLTDKANAVIKTGVVDAQGSLLFRDLAASDGLSISSATERSDTFSVQSADAVPDPALYTNQTMLPAGGFGYITTRDGTTLSANVLLPGPADQGPYPTVVEYSGYQPSDPDSAQLAQVYLSMGLAYVGVNMRGTGCSGGSFRYFEIVQSLDGYDVIEAVAAQPWVLDHQVGMVGISYPGISQLFVAATQPPSLNSITPLSVLDDSFRSTLYPGGILNTGFAVKWTNERVEQAKPFGQPWATKQADNGDTVCADNQLLRLQNSDLVSEIIDNPFYSNPLGDSLAPITFVDRIKVPVFIAGAWQDEQTGGHFPVMLDRFASSPAVYVTLTNGLHTESLSPAIFARYTEFLQLYVAKAVPDLTAINAILPTIGQTLYGVDQVPSFENRFTGMDYPAALAAFQSEKRVRLFVEQGGNPDYAPGTPIPNFTAEFDAWPIPTAVNSEWLLDGTGLLLPGRIVKGGSSSYRADPSVLPATFYSGNSNDIWQADATYDWRPLPDGTGIGFTSYPFSEETLFAGSGSADLWITSSAPDTDLEVTISEVRGDGTEIYIQSGWLRASQRALDESASTALRPAHTNAKADAAPLDPGQPTLVRVELFPFAHPIRVGSRLRITIDAPGNARPIWQFQTVSAGETVTVIHDADHPSKVVLSRIPDIDIPNKRPAACGALRGQPCRPYVPSANSAEAATVAD